MNALKSAQALYKIAEYEAARKDCHRALARDPQDPAAHYLMGMIDFRTGRADDAVSSLLRATLLAPEILTYRTSVGILLAELGRYDEAVPHFQEVLRKEPDRVDCLRALGECLLHGGLPDGALGCYRHALELQPDDPDSQLGIAKALIYLGETDAARTALLLILSRRPGQVQALLNLALLERGVGNIQGATTAYRMVLESEPFHHQAHYALAQIDRPRPGDPRLAALAEHLEDPALVPQVRIVLHLTLGLLYDAVGEHAPAMEQYKLSNEERGRYIGHDYDPTEQERHYDRLIGTFTADRFAGAEARGDVSRLPVFVVGMPRTGTTLVERILNAHPRMVGVGEQLLLKRLRAQLLENWNGQECDELVAALDDATLRTLSEEYAAQLERLAPEAERVVDKTPHNFEELWLVALLFPGARVIHTLRSPLDTCFSCYTTDFQQLHGYRNDLGDLGRHYRQYRRLMEHWKAVLPLEILDVQYEDLTADPETWSRRLVDHVELEWDPACLDHRRGDGAVLTASGYQVSRAVHRGSVGRWRRHADGLAPLMEALGPDLVAEAERLAP